MHSGYLPARDSAKKHMEESAKYTWKRAHFCLVDGWIPNKFKSTIFILTVAIYKCIVGTYQLGIQEKTHGREHILA